MTKGELVVVVSNCDCGWNLSKRSLEDIIDCTFNTMAKDIKKSKRFAHPRFGAFIKVYSN
jgi:nucleoid DNA-binding protein|tara:strand:+ start:347 stop:526 length:180 start_codon:yes stop_codon:yes gene_type:complete